MRQDWPSVERIDSKNGSASLVLEGRSLNRNVPGQVLLFAEGSGANQTTIRATVADVTVYVAAPQGEFEEQGRSRLKAYEEEHGRTFLVVEFAVLRNARGRSVQDLSAAFLELLIDFTSSIDLNPHEGIKSFGYYPDKIAFEPHDQDRKYHTTVLLGTRR